MLDLSPTEKLGKRSIKDKGLCRVGSAKGSQLHRVTALWRGTSQATVHTPVLQGGLQASACQSSSLTAITGLQQRSVQLTPGKWLDMTVRKKQVYRKTGTLRAQFCQFRYFKDTDKIRKGRPEALKPPVKIQWAQPESLKMGTHVWGEVWRLGWLGWEMVWFSQQRQGGMPQLLSDFQWSAPDSGFSPSTLLTSAASSLILCYWGVPCIWGCWVHLWPLPNHNNQKCLGAPRCLSGGAESLPF